MYVMPSYRLTNGHKLPAHSPTLMKEHSAPPSVLPYVRPSQRFRQRPTNSPSSPMANI